LRKKKNGYRKVRSWQTRRYGERGKSSEGRNDAEFDGRGKNSERDSALAKKAEDEQNTSSERDSKGETKKDGEMAVDENFPNSGLAIIKGDLRREATSAGNLILLREKS